LARSLSVSVVTSCIGAIVNALAGLVTAAFLLRQLGLETFGIWALVVSTTSLLWLLDFGTTVAVGRLIAAGRARNDIDGINRIFSTAIAMLGACAIGVALVTWFIPLIFLAVFTVPPQDAADVGLALKLMALASAVHFIAAPFICVLWGYERMDLINLIDVPLVLLRLALLIVFVGTGSPIWIVAACNLVTGCLGMLTNAFVSFRVEPGLAPRPHLATRRTATSVLQLGFDFAALNVAKSVAVQLSPVLVGLTLSNAAVGIFAIARQLSVNCNVLVSATTEAVAARSVRLFHEESHTGQQTLFLEGGRYTTALSCLLTIGMLVMGDSFIHLWQGGRADEAYLQLRILMLGELFALSQWVTYWVIAGMRQHRILVLFAVCEAVTIAGLSYLLVQPFALSGISFAVASAAAIFRGIAPLLYGCRLLGIEYRKYMARVILPNALGGLIGGLAVYWLDAWLDPRDWGAFFVAVFLCGTVSAASLIPFLFPSVLLLKLKPLSVIWRR
jgi:O-antigen/teichoic acid export membrane protein